MQLEQYIHAALCSYIAGNYPQVIFTTDLNGIRLPISLAKRIKYLKSGRGIPDLLIFQPAGNKHGLMLEIKSIDADVYRKDGKLKAKAHTQEQGAMIQRLRALGYAAWFVRGIEAGQDCIRTYMTAAKFEKQQLTAATSLDDYTLEWVCERSVQKTGQK